MRVFALETSCDETSASVVEDGARVLSSVIATASSTVAGAAGVIPEEIARQQVRCILPVISEALSVAQVSWTELDALAVTRGPGLLGSLLIGTTACRALSSLHRLPIVGVHHTLGHLSSPWLAAPGENTSSPQFPVITLSASGGHTDLWYRTSHVHGQLLGRTRDDAAGEAFDKGAHMLGLPFPGGPSLSAAAQDGDERAFTFPHPLHKEDTLDFSFSGLKTSLKYLLRDHPHARDRLSDVAASFQRAINAHLVDRLMRAVARHPEIQEVHVVGGVSANRALRALITQSLPQKTVRVPQRGSYCTDNAAMIASAGYFLVQELGQKAFTPWTTHASLALSDVVRSAEF